MGSVFCAACEQFEPCSCRVIVTAPKRHNALLLVGGVLGAARFYWASSKEKSEMIKDAIIRLNEINRLRTEQTDIETPQKKGK